MGEYSVVGFSIVSRCARANTASLELNINSLYCPSSRAVIYNYLSEHYTIESGLPLATYRETLVAAL